MMADEISLVLDELRNTTDELFLVSNRFDLDQMEAAVTLRQKAVTQLSELIAQYPDAFTYAHLEQVRACHDRGKRAFEKVLEIRRSGWTTATELSQNAHILKSFARFGSLPEHQSNG